MKEIFKKIIKISKEHLVVVFFALLLAILILAPLLAFPAVIKDTYQGINIYQFGGDAHYYLTRGREVLDGHGLGNPLLREGKNETDTHLSYSDYILLAPIKLLGMTQKVNIVTLYHTYNFIGLFFLILLIYFFVWQLSDKKLLSLATSLFVIGGYSIVYFKTLFYSDFNVYARAIYPYFSSLILFLYLNLLLKSLKSAELRYKIFTALAFGLMFYVYFYAWSFILAFNASLFLIFLFKKDYPSAKKVLFISFIGLVLGSYNLIRLFASLGSEWGRQASYFMLMSQGHQPIFSKIGLITLILFLIFVYRQRNDKNSPLFLAVILSSWIALNQQVITGKMLQYGHYYWYFIVPLSIIAIFYMAWLLIKKEKWQRLLFVIVIIVVFINTAGGQYQSFFTSLRRKTYEQNFRPIIDSLNREQNPTVILVPQSNAYLFTIYTSHDLFWNSVSLVNHTPIQRAKDALFVYFYLNKKSRNDFSGFINKIMIDENSSSYDIFDKILFQNIEGFESGYDYYGYLRRLTSGDSELKLKREKMLPALTSEYQNLAKDSKNITQLLKDYGVKFIVWDKNENPWWDLSFFDNLKEVTHFNNIYLYQFFNE